MVKSQIAGRKRTKKRDAAQLRRVTQLVDAIDVTNNGMQSQAIPSETTKALETVREASLACEQRDMKDIHDSKRQTHAAIEFMQQTLKEATFNNNTESTD